MAEEFKPSKIFRRKQVEAHTGLSRSTIYAWVRDGLFPAPISLGPKAVGWLESELDAWLAERTRASRSPDGEQQD
ncbi:MAG: helix-turn-helix transcriptional regulator [Gemmatimonas sp.]